MNRRTLLSLLCRGVGAAASAAVLSQCESTGGGGLGGGGSLRTATKENPFVNSLGMKFVPVPGTRVLFCTTETTVAQYQAAGMGYQAPAFSQGSDHPAVNVSWHNAMAWCQWLSRKEGKHYRLPTDAEWSAAVGPTTYPWGNQWPPPNNFGNYCGQEFKTQAGIDYVSSLGWKAGQWSVIGGFSDRHVFTAPVGSYAANAYGIHDLGGNVGECCGDGTVLRGGSWSLSNRDHLASSDRNFAVYDFDGYGFRVVVGG